MTQRPTGCSEADCDTVAFTVAALAANPADEDLVKLSHRVAPLVTEWDALHADRRRLERAVIAASAQVRVADATLDLAIETFAADLLEATGGDHDSGLYKRFFTEHHEDIIAMGLDSEVPVVTLLVAALDTTDDLPPKLKAHAAPLRAGLQLGNSALVSRADALGELGRHVARELAWGEAAESSLVSVHRALERLADTRDLSPSWADAFFE